MKAAILASRANSYVLPMAQGLKRLFDQVGVEASLLHRGLSMIESHCGPAWKVAMKKMLSHSHLWRLYDCDIIVVVMGAPLAFLRSLKVERIRRLFPRKPVVLYANYYLPTRPWLARWLEEGSPQVGIPEGDQFGLERYDWYLCSSVVSRSPMPGGRQPYSLVGVNLDDGTLFPQHGDEFVALIDFERPRHMKERAIQIQALEETNTSYAVLNGHYSVEEIRSIYRKCSMYFVAHSESFGLPICELQACGSYVFTPYAVWCQSHWIKEDLSASGPGELSPNFVVYDNDKDRLVAQIKRLRDSYDPDTVVKTFRHYHPQLHHGDPDQLRKFVDLVARGEIHSRSHESYPRLDVLHGSELDTSF
jgi:hypothetical protein